MGKMMRPDIHSHYHHPSSSSSSIDSNTNSVHQNEYYYSLSSAASCTSSTSLSSTNLNHSNYTKDHLSTDLQLGLSLSHHHDRFSSSSSPRGQYSDWPPIKGVLRSTKLSNNSRPTTRGDDEEEDNMTTLFVKVYMEGIPIGRKLDLLSLHGYHPLISTLSQMFKTTLLYPDIFDHKSSEKYHILTYEDKEGDWMMVGDVPWEMFLTTVKRLKIVILDRCQ